MFSRRQDLRCWKMLNKILIADCHDMFLVVSHMHIVEACFLLQCCTWILRCKKMHEAWKKTVLDTFKWKDSSDKCSRCYRMLQTKPSQNYFTLRLPWRACWHLYAGYTVLCVSVVLPDFPINSSWTCQSMQACLYSGLVQYTVYQTEERKAQFHQMSISLYETWMQTT